MRVISLSPSRLSLNSPALLTSDQIRTDATVSNFSSQVSNPIVLGSLLLGGQAFQLGRMAGSRLTGILPQLSVLTELTSFATGIACETSVFRASQNFLAGLAGQTVHNPTFSSAWLSTALDLSLFKGFASLTAGSNILTQHLAQDIAVVGGRHLCQALGLNSEPVSGNWIRDLADAEAMNLQMAFSASLNHLGFGGRIGVLERNLARTHSLSPFAQRPVRALETQAPSLRRLLLGAMTLVGCAENSAHYVAGKVPKNMAHPYTQYVPQIFLGGVGILCVYLLGRSALRAHRAHKAGMFNDFLQPFLIETMGDGINHYEFMQSWQQFDKPRLEGLGSIKEIQDLARVHFSDSRTNPYDAESALNRSHIITLIKHEQRLINIPSSKLAEVAERAFDNTSVEGENNLAKNVRIQNQVEDITWAWYLLLRQASCSDPSINRAAHSAMMRLKPPIFMHEAVFTGNYQGVEIRTDNRIALIRLTDYLVRNNHPNAEEIVSEEGTSRLNRSTLALIRFAIFGLKRNPHDIN